MALISLGESRWRMLRRALRSKRFNFTDCRNQTRNDQEHFDWLVEHEFFQPLGNDLYEVSVKGKSAADLGFYEV